MLRQLEWQQAFANEVMRLSAGALGAAFAQSVAIQQWAVLGDENPSIAAQRWASRSGLVREVPLARPPTMLIWLSECSEELQRQQPALGRGVADALALLQWDQYRELDPVDAALHWIASRPQLGGHQTAQAKAPA